MPRGFWQKGDSFIIVFLRIFVVALAAVAATWQYATTAGWIASALGAVLGIIGGVYALQRKYWGLALAGAIAGSISFFPCGIVAIIFTAMAKPEFDAISTIQTT